MANRVVYLPYYRRGYKCLKRKEILNWLTICKKVGFLPKYANIRDITTNERFTVDVFKHTHNELYMYLTCVRIPAEHPNLVRTTLNLMKNDLDFFAAFVVACAVGPVANSNHLFIIDNYCSYMQDIRNKVDNALIVALAAFSKIYKNLRSVNNCNISKFNCNTTINKIRYNVVASKCVKGNDISANCILNAESISLLNDCAEIGLNNYNKFTKGLIISKMFKGGEL